MSRTALTVQSVTHAGTTITTANVDSANGNSFPNTSGFPILLYMNNTSTVASVGTVHANVTIDTSLTVPDRLVTVAGGSTVVAGPFPSSVYNQTDGSVYINFTPTTGVGLSVFTHGS